MDDLDLAVMRFFLRPGNLRFDVRSSFADAARDVGASEDTVRARFQRMMDCGLLGGWTAFINPSLLGRQLARIEGSARGLDKAEVLEQITHIDGLTFMFDFLGDDFACACYAEPGAGLARSAKLVAALTGQPTRTAVIDIPAATMEPNREDWRLIQEVRQDPRVSYADLASRMGASERTVRRRHQRLVEGRAMFLGVQSNFEKLHGRFVVEGRAWSDEPSGIDAVRKVAEGWTDLAFAGFSAHNAIVSRFVTNANEVTHTKRALADIEGLNEVRVDIIQRRLVDDEWLDQAIEKRLV